MYIPDAGITGAINPCDCSIDEWNELICEIGGSWQEFRRIDKDRPVVEGNVEIPDE